MSNILINAIGDSNWIGGLYYAMNISFVLSCNEWIRNRYKVYILTNSSNSSFFEVIPSNTKVDLIKGTNPWIVKIQKALAYKRYNIKYIYMGNKDMSKYGMTTIRWIPDFQHVHFPNLFKPDAIEARNKRYLEYANSDLPLVLSSNDSKNDLLTHFECGNKHVMVVPFVSWIEPEIQMLNDSLEREILDKKKLSRQKYVVIMNQFWQHKNHIVVFEAIKKLFAFYPDSDLQFVFTGQMEDYRNPDYIDQLKQIADDPLVSPHIKLLGFIDRTEQIAIMKNAAFVIQPSLFEGWGTVVEDAKVLDKTILLSDIPVHREQMNDKCILFDPHDPVALADLIYQESQKEHHDDVEKGIADMYKRAKEYSKGFEQLLRDLEKK